MKKVINKNRGLKDYLKKIQKIIIEPEKRERFVGRQTMSEEKNHGRPSPNLNPEETQKWLSFPTPQP